ncbi:MAG: DUF4399 domain-containing protein [Myxococcota bacterium]
MKNSKHNVLSAILLLTAPACFDDAPKGSVGFVTPGEGEVSSTDVFVKIALVNIDLEQFGNHLYLLVDEPCLAPGQKMSVSASRIDFGLHTEANVMMLPGDHDLCAQIADANGEATDQMDTVHFTVRAHPEAAVEIVSPYDGAAETATFTVKLAATGIAIVPAGPAVEDQGHFYLRIDGDCPVVANGKLHGNTDLKDLSHGESEVELTLEMGYHDLCAGLADNEENVLPAASKKIRVYVAY